MTTYLVPQNDREHLQFFAQILYIIVSITQPLQCRQKPAVVSMLRRVANVITGDEPLPSFPSDLYEEVLKSVEVDRNASAKEPKPLSKRDATANVPESIRKRARANSSNGEIKLSHLSTGNSTTDEDNTRTKRVRKNHIQAAELTHKQRGSSNAVPHTSITRPLVQEDAARTLLSLTKLPVTISMSQCLPDTSTIRPFTTTPTTIRNRHKQPLGSQSPSQAIETSMASTTPPLCTADSSTGTVVSPSSKKKNKASKVNKGAELVDISYSISKEIHRQKITELRDTFCNQLTAKKVSIQVSQQSKEYGFTEDEAIDITNFLFTDLIGWPALRRLRTLLTEYSKQDDYETSPKGIARAERIAKDPSTPTAFQEYFSSISRANRLALGNNASSKTQCQFNNLQETLENIKAHRFYTEIMQAAEAGDEVITSFLIENGYKNREQGRTWKSAAKRFIITTLESSARRLDLQRQQNEAVSFMVELFGTGIIPIFPTSALSKLRKWGIGRTKAALTLFKEIFPFLEEISEALNSHVYLPITTGSDIQFRHRKLSGTRPLIELIRASVSIEQQAKPI